MAPRRVSLAAALATLCAWRLGGAWLLPGASRREMLSLAGLGAMLQLEPAVASGGSTAGKYSTIPSGKRRFYGRVRQGMYQCARKRKEKKRRFIYIYHLLYTVYK